jgi:uncharacterized membrane protein
VQAVYALQALSIGLALLGDGVVVTAVIVALPAAAGFVLNHLRRDALRGTAYESHIRWQQRSVRLVVLALGVTTLLLGPLLFAGLTLLGFAYGLIGLWLAWRIARGVTSLQRSRPLPGDQLANTRSGKDA